MGETIAGLSVKDWLVVVFILAPVAIVLYLQDRFRLAHPEPTGEK